MDIRLAAGLLALTLANDVLADEPQRLIKDAIWKHRPNGQEFASLYPQKAQSPQKGGWAVVSCRAKADGALETCKIAAEAPAGLGFGASAVAMAEKYFKLEPRTKSGDAVDGGYVHIPIVYQGLGGAAEAPPRITYKPARPAMLLTIAEQRDAQRGTFPCPTPETPQARCVAHEIFWKSEPDLEISAPILRGAGQTTGVSLLDCAVGDSGKLVNCQVQGEVTPGGRAAILELASKLEAPEKAIDKTPTAKGQLVAVFDWAAILKANEVLLPVATKP